MDRRVMIAGAALVSLSLGACENARIGVGIGGTSGNFGGGISTSVPLGEGADARSSRVDAVVTLFRQDQVASGPSIGTIMLKDTDQGLRIETALGQLPPGTHRLQLHDSSDCGAVAAQGRLIAGGDMPFAVATDGNAAQTIFYPALKVKDAKGRAFAVSVDGKRIACGVLG